MNEENEVLKKKRPVFEAFDITDSRAQVCSNLGLVKTLARLKAKIPGNWKLAKKYFGENNPDVCPESGKHKDYLFVLD